tara:strand:+ start:1232 stop:2200 length:969 start_codon:yes stop_codon:yes gene_type:complete
MKNLKTLILSPGNSGGGAVFEYLRSRDDFVSPFNNEEFRMVGDPDGLYNLYLECYKNFSLYGSSLAIQRFLKYNKRLASLKVQSHNKKVKLCSKGYESIINNFVKSISEIKYFANPQFYRMRLNKIDKTKIFLNERINGSLKNSRPFKVIIPKEENLFINNSIELIDKILLNNIRNKKTKKNIVIDQAVNILKPLESSVFYGNRKIIIVTRDPKSIFASMKRRKSFGFPGYDLKIFIEWYRWIMKKMNFKKSNLVLKIGFESFILDNEKNIKKIENFLKIKKNVNNKFNFMKSEKNIYKAKKILSLNEIKKINKDLKDYIIW